jgi:hypothetical protein
VPVTTQIPHDQVIARTALGGALLAKPGGNTAIVMFAGNAQDALNLFETQASVAPPALQPHLGDILFRLDDVVVLWATGPSTAQGTLLGDCLR